MPPAARITDFHACPMVTPGTPPIPHVGGPIMKGSHNVLTGKLPQARVGDMAMCVGPMDVIVKGSSGVFVNKMPAARIGDQTAHGGTIVAGFPTVIIGETKAGGGGGAALPNTAAVQFAYTEVLQQMQVLIDAWKTAAPFCEACFKKAMGNSLPAPEEQPLSFIYMREHERVSSSPPRNSGGGGGGGGGRSWPVESRRVAAHQAETLKLGTLSARYETGNRGPGTVSPGDTVGGVSYGLYQLSTSMGRPQEFLASEGAPWADEFRGLKPGTQQFSDVWQSVSAKEPDAFGAAQHRYIDRTHYQPVVAAVMSEIGLDIGGASNALQQAVWSTAVQHGPGTKVVHRALAKLSASDPMLNNTTDADVINAIYDERSRRNADGELAYFSNSNAHEQQGIADRFANERRDALALLSSER